MDVREKFVLKALEGSASMSALCRQFGISRKSGYKWLARYRAYGIRGLEDLSRRPGRSPLATTADVVAEVVAIRNVHRSWGPKKIREVLQREKLVQAVPGARTIARILERAGYIQPLRRRARRRPQGGPPQLIVRRPNDVWTVDFKGWWLSARSHERCEPLTVRDAFSRFVLEVRVLSTTQGDTVRRVFEKAFERYGLPRTILTDNGSPFATMHGALGLTRLTVWWLSLGIDVQHSRPATPSDNGGHERMHRDMKAELQAFAALTRKAQQRECDRWRHEFNHHRPHEALGMKVPAELYRRSVVRYDGRPADPSYPQSFHRRKVSKQGMIRLGLNRLFLSSALAKQQIGLEPLEPDRYAIWFYGKRLGVADFTSTPALVDTNALRAPALASLPPARHNRHLKAAA